MAQRIGRELTLSGRTVARRCGSIGVGYASDCRSPACSATGSTDAYRGRGYADIRSRMDQAERSRSAGRDDSVRTGRPVPAKGTTLRSLIAIAYGVRETQISGGPSWVGSTRYDIDAKPEVRSDADDPHKIASDDQREKFEERQRMRIQALLADRFQLKLGHSTKELPVYVLNIAKNGPKMQESKEESGNRFRGVRMGGPGRLTGEKVPMKFLAELLAGSVGRTVIDQTGLKGKYDFKLEWTPDRSQQGAFGGGPGPGPDGALPPPADPNGPSIFTAVEEQLDLSSIRKKVRSRC